MSWDSRAPTLHVVDFRSGEAGRTGHDHRTNRRGEGTIGQRLGRCGLTRNCRTPDGHRPVDSPACRRVNHTRSARWSARKLFVSAVALGQRSGAMAGKCGEVSEPSRPHPDRVVRLDDAIRVGIDLHDLTITRTNDLDVAV